MGEDKDTLVLWVEAIYVNRGADWSSVIANRIARTEARVAELEAQIGVLFDTIKRGEYESREQAEGDAANFEQLREGYVSAQARIAELEILLDKAQNEIIMEAGERAAYQVSCAEMEKQMHVKDTCIQKQQIQIASLTEELNNSRQREMARF